MRKTRVLIVDDSATQRRLIAHALEGHDGIEVIAEAADAYQARDLVKTMNPDVLTLDVEMPGMNGLEFLARLMKSRPRPVIMISSYTRRGADAAVQALGMGAIACIGKPAAGNPDEVYRHLPDLIRTAARARLSPAGGHVKSRPYGPSTAPIVDENFRSGHWMVAIGSSTGGVEALTTVLSNYPSQCPPTLITQHMPGNFLRSLAARLNSNLSPEVKVADAGEVLAPGRVLFAPGDRHMILDRSDRIVLLNTPPENGHCPSVDVMYRSLVPRARHVLAVQLTGMGADGAQEMLALRMGGARTIGQDEATSTIYGMPARAFELGAVERQLPLDRIGPAILDMTRTAETAQAR
ncbi:two-component system, chemotaxis family, response regulator CheB [Poseidonocella pacifica]|uniref:Protein-glutamate methylesterase/protein-glutamine glutaminase n=1 Tax=Poseidonocella pacifica TaxID=871651 RepID=A0A1I0X1H8_9RHOB|nr:chemotaxis response regulator protein-glutamate methylesterase [Poseidonocella pacifica]SFA94862.1 two-component system, chemotaxis family, response regulator CheB [Poseidonocella pacifica]